MRLRVLTWNLWHGRSRPAAWRDQRPEFTAALQQYQWDVALLQEVPSWWPAPLTDALGAECRFVLTSRNGLPGIRRAIATRVPDLIRSNGGGCNAILARSDRIVDDRALQLRRLPERRWVHAARLACGIWIANLHASTEGPRAISDGDRAAEAALGWAAGEPLVLGGDFNQRRPQLDRLQPVAARDVDHIFVSDELRLAGEAEMLDRGTLSDHPPLAVTLERPE